MYYDTSQYYTWPNILEEKSGEEAHDFFKYGDPLQIININTRYVGNFGESEYWKMLNSTNNFSH